MSGHGDKGEIAIHRSVLAFHVEIVAGMNFKRIIEEANRVNEIPLFP